VRQAFLRIDFFAKSFMLGKKPTKIKTLTKSYHIYWNHFFSMITILKHGN